MKRMKQWHLSFYDENDIAYVQDLGCEYEVRDKLRTTEVKGPSGQIYHIRDSTFSYGLEFITENERQEIMIQLKYAGEVKLLRMWHTNEWTRYEFQSYV